MATTKQVEYKSIPKLSKVAIPVTLKAGVASSTVSVTLTIPAGLSVLTPDLSAGTFDGTDTWTIGTTTAGTDYVATFYFLTTEAYASGWTVTATVSTEPEDELATDNVISVKIVEDANANEEVSGGFAGLTYYDGTAAQTLKVHASDGGWVIQDLVKDLTSADASDFTTVTVSVPAALADAITAGDIVAEAYARSADDSIIVYPGTVAVNAGAVADDGTASSATLGLDNASAVNVADGTAFTGTFNGRLIISFYDGSGIIS